MFRRFISYYRKRRQRLFELGECPSIDLVDIHESVVFVNRKGVKLGEYIYIGPKCYIDGLGGVSIGDGTVLGPNVTILSASHLYDQVDCLPYNKINEFRPVHIGRGCWLGWGAMIVPGAKIGDGCIIGMGAVVSSRVPDGSIVLGNPAKPVKVRGNMEFVKNAIDEQRYYIKEKKNR